MRLGGIMLGQHNVVPTVAVADMARARRFYGETLGLEVFMDQGDFGVVYNAGASNLLVYLSEFAGTNRATYLAFDVPSDSFDTEVAILRSKGVKFDTFDLDEYGSWDDGVATTDDVKGVWFRDPDGNILNVMTR
jgi:catechol 2,3-dioxygenase-like lactoylglutathione lyase family enzyme